jgi:hypothetical protein
VTSILLWRACRFNWTVFGGEIGWRHCEKRNEEKRPDEDALESEGWVVGGVCRLVDGEVLE